MDYRKRTHYRAATLVYPEAIEGFTLSKGAVRAIHPRHDSTTIPQTVRAKPTQNRFECSRIRAHGVNFARAGKRRTSPNSDHTRTR